MSEYGGIELKRSAARNTYLGLAYSIGLHVLLILLYCGWTWLTAEDTKKTTGLRHRPDGGIIVEPPPSISQDIVAPFFPAPKVDITKPSFGIPIPVPDIEAPNITLPTVMSTTSQSTTSSGTLEGVISASNNINEVFHVQQATETEPDESQFIPDITEDATPTENIQLMTKYPETARIAGLEGKVAFSALIGKDGRVERVVIDKADYEVFKQPVIDAVMMIRFTPAKQNETPVRVWYSQTISFKLH